MDSNHSRTHSPVESLALGCAAETKTLNQSRKAQYKTKTTATAQSKPYRRGLDTEPIFFTPSPQAHLAIHELAPAKSRCRLLLGLPKAVAKSCLQTAEQTGALR
jgi:hypothetical protein